MTVESDESVIDGGGNSRWPSATGSIQDAITCVEPVLPEQNGLGITAQYRACGGLSNSMLQEHPELRTEYQAGPWRSAGQPGGHLQRFCIGHLSEEFQSFFLSSAKCSGRESLMPESPSLERWERTLLAERVS